MARSSCLGCAAIHRPSLLLFGTRGGFTCDAPAITCSVVAVANLVGGVQTTQSLPATFTTPAMGEPSVQATATGAWAAAKAVGLQPSAGCCSQWHGSAPSQPAEYCRGMQAWLQQERPQTVMMLRHGFCGACQIACGAQLVSPSLSPAPCAATPCIHRDVQCQRVRHPSPQLWQLAERQLHAPAAAHRRYMLRPDLHMVSGEGVSWLNRPTVLPNNTC